MSTIDLNSPPSGHNYTVKVEPEETSGERCVRLTKDFIVFVLAVVFVVVLGYICLTTVMSATVGLEEKKWAMYQHLDQTKIHPEQRENS